jgi:hypothetical protein
MSKPSPVFWDPLRSAQIGSKSGSKNPSYLRRSPYTDEYMRERKAIIAE